jgi:hypothetical protein
MAVRSALRAGRPLSPQEDSWYSFRLIRPSACSLLFKGLNSSWSTSRVHYVATWFSIRVPRVSLQVEVVRKLIALQSLSWISLHSVSRTLGLGFKKASLPLLRFWLLYILNITHIKDHSMVGISTVTRKSWSISKNSLKRLNEVFIRERSVHTMTSSHTGFWEPAANISMGGTRYTCFQLPLVFCRIFCIS